MNLMVIYIYHLENRILVFLAAFYGNINASIKNKLMDKNGRILILEGDSDYHLIDFYNGNTEKEQFNTLEFNFITL